MSFHENIAKIANLLGDKSRASMLVALMGNKALTAGELAFIANISPQTASNHLNKLVQENLLVCIAMGRHRYYKLASSSVAKVIESLGLLANSDAKPSYHKQYIDKEIKKARSCYDHIAGTLGVQITKSLISKNYLIFSDESFTLTEHGKKFFSNLNIDLEQLIKKRRHYAKPCLDWTEREYHMAGSLGKSLLDYFIDNRLVLCSKRKARVLVLTEKGKAWLNMHLEIKL